MTEQTIIVKKADGSLVRMPLSHVKKMQGQKTPTPKSPAPVAATTGGDAKPLLHEELPATHAHLPLVSSSRQTEVDQVLKKLSFSPAPGVVPRLATVIRLRLKDIRSEEETRGVLERPQAKNGFGFTPAQTKELLTRCHEVMQSTGSAPGTKATMPEPGRTGVNLPARIGEEHVTIATPNNAFVHERLKVLPRPPGSAQNSGPRPPGSVQKNPATPKGLAPTPTPAPLGNKTAPMDAPAFKLNSQPIQKTVMTDVVSRPTEVGPIEEIRSVTLTDFRRLSHNPTEAAARLKQKFINLQSESILLYLDAWDAWRMSPLYQEYVKLINDHLNKGTPLSSAAADKNTFQIPEITALVQMEKELSVV
jgi:hypothetical protein